MEFGPVSADSRPNSLRDLSIGTGEAEDRLHSGQGDGIAGDSYQLGNCNGIGGCMLSNTKNHRLVRDRLAKMTFTSHEIALGAQQTGGLADRRVFGVPDHQTSRPVPAKYALRLASRPVYQ